VKTNENNENIRKLCQEFISTWYHKGFENFAYQNVFIFLKMKHKLWLIFLSYISLIFLQLIQQSYHHTRNNVFL